MASIQKRSNGKYLVRWRNEENKEWSKQFDLMRDAKRYAAQIETELARGTYVDPTAGLVTLQGFYDEWAQRQVWTYNTQQGMMYTLRSCSFADVSLNRIRKSHVEAWIKSMSEKYAASTIQTRVRQVRTVVRAAVDDGLISKDPMQGVRIPRSQTKRTQMRIPTFDEVNKIISCAEDWFQPYIALCAFAGLRRGEACGVQLGDVDFLDRSIHVVRQVQDKPVRDYEVRAPKHGSDRVVYIPEELTLMLSEHVRQIGVSGEERWLFPGQPMRTARAVHWWREAVKAAGVEGVTLHDLRHFYASGLIAAGCDVVTVQRAMGHANATTTLNTYSHMWPDAADRTRAAAGGLMRSVFDAIEDQVRTENESTPS